MVPEDLDELIENAKYRHLSREMLVSYRDNLLDTMRVALADAHLKRCLICQEKLKFLRERAEVESRMTEAERAALEQSDRRVKAELDAPSFISTQIEALKSFIDRATETWKLLFAAEATLGSEGGDEIFRYESEDGLLTTMLEREDASLTVRFTSPNLDWEGARLRFRLGPFTEEVILRAEDSKVVAEINIPLEKRASDMADISIEIV